MKAAGRSHPKLGKCKC